MNDKMRYSSLFYYEHVEIKKIKFVRDDLSLVLNFNVIIIKEIIMCYLVTSHQQC